MRLATILGIPTVAHIGQSGAPSIGNIEQRWDLAAARTTAGD
jgi:hypothetical protein